jgi:glycosyltransferase involved in cell wall biosynthesis
MNKDVSCKPTLLYVVEAMGGGVFTYLVDLSNALCAKYDIYIAYATREQTPTDFKDYFDKKIKFIKVENFERSISFDKDFKAAKEIRKIVDNVKPDIVHLHSSKAGVIGRWILNGHKIPMFYTPHGYSFLMADANGIKRMFYKFVEWITAKRCCTTISCSAGENRETLALTKKAEYISNGINVDDLQNMLNDIKKEDTGLFTVFTLGRICYQKNPTVFNSVAEKMPNVNFVWIGDGELRNELKAKNITVTGWVDRKEALRFACQSDVFMLTSLWEGLPISLLEAMYMKKLCVVSNVIGNNDVIKSGENGFVCNKEDEYITAIQYALDNDTETLTNNAYDCILNEYNTRVISMKYCSIYDKSLKKFLSQN